MLLASSAAAAAEIPSHMRGKWCGVPDDTYVKGPCGDGSLDTDVEMTVTATGFKVNDTECKAIQVTPFDDYPWGRRATKNPWGPRYRFKFRCSDGKISEQEWWIEKDSYLLIDVKRRSSAEPSNPWGVAIENILVETVTRVTIYGSACAQIPDWLREAGAKVIEDIKRQKAAHKLDAAYLQMVKEKDKMGADAWCKSAKPYIDDFLKIQPPEQEIVTRQNMLPPLKYDHPYAGKLEIERVRDFAELSKRCETPEGVNRIACAKVYGPNREYRPTIAPCG
jgi:hypothetical protein